MLWQICQPISTIVPMRSHHSHSGEYISHGSDTLEEVAARATALKFKSFCFTEHQPRAHELFLYPEEKAKHYEVKDLEENFNKYYRHAREIKYRPGSTNFFVGFEAEAIDEEHIDRAVQIMKDYRFDLCVGGVHFVKSIPIDFNEKLWDEAKTACGGVYQLFDEYFELQFKMLVTLEPTVVAHFDLIRLMCSDAQVDTITGKNIKSEINIETDWPQIWKKIVRNIQYVASYGGLFELNSAALRKGWSTPYPQPDIAKAICRYGQARFCLSDDSHSVSQVGLNYKRMFEYIQTLGLEQLYFLDQDENGVASVCSESLEEIKTSEFYKGLFGDR